MIGIVREPGEAQPAALVTVTSSPTLPLVPAVNVIARVPAPAVIVPFVIDQAYVAPGPASDTEALCPAAPGHTEEGAVIAADGSGLTLAVVVAAPTCIRPRWP